MTAAPALAPTVRQLAAALQQRGWLMATAESCTGGQIAAACTDLAGSSLWFDRGFVTYSNAAKTEMLGVPAALIATHGAVREAVVRAMARGCAPRPRSASPSAAWPAPAGAVPTSPSARSGWPGACRARCAAACTTSPVTARPCGRRPRSWHCNIW